MGNLTIRKQVIIASIIAILLFIATSIFISIVSNSVDEKEHLRDMEIVNQMSMQDARYHIVQIQQFLTDASLTGNTDPINEALTNKNAVLAIAHQYIQIDPNSSTEVNEIIDLINQLYVTGEEMIVTYNNSGQSAGNEIMTKAFTGFDARSENLSTAFEQFSKHINAKEQRLDKALKVAKAYLIKVNLIGSILQLLIIIALCALIFMRILPAITRLNNSIVSLATGDKDLSQRLTIKKEDELGQIAHSVNHFTAELDAMLAAISKASGRLHKTTKSFQQNAEEASAGMTEVHLHTDMLATAINEMASTVIEVARNTEQAAEIANSARDSTISGETIVNESIEIIKTLSNDIDDSATQIQTLLERSEKIGDIINVIKSISDQTNLLALNAAIEAARAGDAGRGFAVVADEVRSLAKNTQDSAAEIEAMIDQIQQDSQRVSVSMKNNIEKAATTVDKAQLAGESLQEIAKSVTQLADVNMQIATASEQQTMVSEEINKSILQVANIASDTLDTTNKVGLASIECMFSAGEVADLVSQFKVTNFAGEHDPNKLVEWSDAYSVHVASIDNQHRKLFDLMNDVYQLVISAQLDNLNKPLDELIAYAKKHLFDEEKILESVNYPDLVAHKKVHVKLLTDLENLYTQAKTGNIHKLFELVMFLKNWLVDHIYKVDMKYSELLVSKGIK